jgi:mannose-6-phosphate isomerase-like protein (cupin superfamily)
MTARRYAIQVERVEKPWGHELVWARTEGYCGKILCVRAGEALSLQVHRVKDESWYVLDGRARVELGDEPASLEEQVLGPGDALRLPPGTVHRITALEDTRILEASSPELEGAG